MLDLNKNLFIHCKSLQLHFDSYDINSLLQLSCNSCFSYLRKTIKETF